MLKPITIAVDRYKPFSVPELLKLQKARVRGLPVGGIVAYIGRHTRGLPNGITPQDLQNYVDHGFKVIFNFEAASNHRSYFNALEGNRDGRDIVLELAWLGVKPDPELIVYDSVDYDAYTQADFTAVDAYQAALVNALGGQFSDGEYGGIAVLKHSNGTKHAPSGEWQTIAWSNNQVFPGIKMYQVQVNAWVAGMLVDVNEVYADPGWYPRPLTQANPNKGVSNVSDKVKVNGVEFPATVVNGDTYIQWNALESLPGFSKTKVNGEWEFTVQPPTPLRTAFPGVESGGFTYPAFIVPTPQELGAAGTEVATENFGIRVLQALNAPTEQIVHYLVNWYGYAQDIAENEAAQGYPVLQQSADMYKPIARVLIAHKSTDGKPQDVTTETITDAVNVTIFFADGSSTQFSN